MCCTESCSRSLTDGKATCWAGPCSQTAQELTQSHVVTKCRQPKHSAFLSSAWQNIFDGLSTPEEHSTALAPSHWAVPRCHMHPSQHQLGALSLCWKSLSYSLCHGCLCISLELPWSSTGISWGCHRDFSLLPVWSREPPGALAKPSVKQRHSAGEWDMNSEPRFLSQELYLTLRFSLTLGLLLCWALWPSNLISPELTRTTRTTPVAYRQS